jgi:ATP-dependent DNA ligase
VADRTARVEFGEEPMLARAVDRLPAESALPGGSAYEPKFDGYRALLHISAAGCRIQSRRGHDITESFADIASAAAEQFPHGVVVDGELVVWGDGALDFTELQRRLTSGRRLARKPASFVAFDVLEISGADIRAWPLTRRREALELLMQGATPPLEVSPQTTHLDEAQAWMHDYAEHPVGIEGVVIKGLDTRYVPGRRDWLKLRLRDTVEAVVGGVIGTIAAPDRLVLGLYRDGELAVAGSTAPLNPRQQKSLRSLLRPGPADHPWPDALSQGRLGHFGRSKTPIVKVEPTLVVEISADSAFERGRWRHTTRFIRPRPDLMPDEISPPE